MTMPIAPEVAGNEPERDDAEQSEEAPAPAGPTTAHHTHRSLRLALALIVLTLFISVFWQSALNGWAQLPSISHAFYTPAGYVFVAALVAASLALLALSGRDVESTLLNIAAIFAPLIALIPTGFDNSAASPGLSCPSGTECVPEPYLAAVRNGVLSYVTVVVVVAVLAVIVRAVGGLTIRGTILTGGIALLVAGGLAVLAFVPPFNDGFPFNGVLPISIHYAVTIAFFGSFAAVPIVNAWPRKREPGEAPLKRWHRVVYVAVPIGIVLDLALMFALKGAWPGAVFWGEAGALFLFACFWAVQTIQRWDEGNQRSVTRRDPAA